MADIIGDTSITPILSSDYVDESIANTAHDELKAMMDEIQAHHNGSLVHDGDFDVDGNSKATTLESDVATGTAPLTVASTTKVANLNADKLDGETGTDFHAAGNLTGTISDSVHGNRGGGALHADATTSVDGFMTAADKTKLDGITGANLGAWLSRANNTNYQASTDGFVVAYTNDGVTPGDVIGYTNASTPPTVIRALDGDNSVASYTSNITFPVKKDDYWKVTGVGSGAIWWIPLGT